MSPNTLGQNGTRTVTVNGGNFQSGASTSVSGTGVSVASTTFVSSSKLTVKVKAAASGTTAGVRTVRVVNPDKGTGLCVGCFTVT